MLWTTLCGARLACWREIRVPVLPGATLMLEGVSQEHAAVCSLVLEVELANSTTVAAQVLTSQYDNLRTGVTLREKILTPQNVNANQFGKQGGYKVDGAVYAQPLFIPSVEIPGKGSLR